MFAQRPIPTTPNNPKNPDAPVMADTNGEPPIVPSDPCDEISYEIEIENVVWDADLPTLTSIIDSIAFEEVNLGDLPDSFNIAIVQLVHPLESFTEYSFDISIEQSGSSKPVVLRFTHGVGIEITPLYDTEEHITGLKIEDTGVRGDGGVASNVPVETILPGRGEKCINVQSEGKRLVFLNGETCELNSSADSFCDTSTTGEISRW